VDDVWVKASGSTWARNQSLKVSQPWDEMTRDETLFVDQRRQRYVFENRDPLPGGFVFGNKVVVSGGQAFAANDRDRLVQTLNPANLPGITLNYVRRLPHLLLALALEQRTPTLRYAGEETFDGRPHHVVTFAAANGVLMSLFFDAKTNLLSKYEQMVSDPVDGDVVQETIYPGYRAVEKLMVPTGRQTRRGGDLIEDVKGAMSGLLKPERRETFIGYAEILEVFQITKVGKVAGCRVTEGIVERGAGVRLLRDNVVIHEGKLSTLKRFKDEVKEVPMGQECGMAFEKYEDIRPGDVIECFRVEQVTRSL
jgi:hypothetical protein